MQMSASEPVPDKEEDVEEGVLEQTDIRQSGRKFRLFKTAFDFFYSIDPSMIWALKLKQMVEGGLVSYRKFLEK